MHSSARRTELNGLGRHVLGGSCTIISGVIQVGQVKLKKPYWGLTTLL